MRNVLIGAGLVLLYGDYWIPALIGFLLVTRVILYIHEVLDCLSWVHNNDYAGTEEGEYY